MTREALLPVPPSTNELFFNAARGRVKTEKYDRWISTAGLLLNAARLGLADGPSMVCVRLGKVNESRDIDNVIKPICDLLVKCRVLKDDNLRHVHAVLATKDFEDVPADYVAVSVRPSEGKR